ncbi:hypothetical protein BCR43DRAFT_433717 [Syncephalastrum racemosum]|uniref:Eukaryotic mitochondrial regulator protein-domain-containing protein n=1 Tax=Syncephalastrum racemosum TaxID=13706 RepID=A0A1X2HQY0_SYNRA|nr:hypothetical protein BCR43DRAFT_433717 [Syncephalastrum racemosum]
MLASLQTAARNAALVRPTLYTSSRCIATSLRLCNDQPTQDETAKKQDTESALDEQSNAEAEATTTTTPEEEPAAPIKESRRRRRFHEWANGAGKKYARAADGTTNYLNGETPFPNNPLFRPRPPISDAQRQKLYDTYLSDPESWTIRKLATKFNISIRMERLMGADQSVTPLNEPLVDVFPPVRKPFFKSLEEDADFGHKDAAKVLKRMPFGELREHTIRKEEADFHKKTVVKGEKKGNLLIVDTSARK